MEARGFRPNVRTFDQRIISDNSSKRIRSQATRPFRLCSQLYYTPSTPTYLFLLRYPPRLSQLPPSNRRPVSTHRPILATRSTILSLLDRLDSIPTEPFDQNSRSIPPTKLYPSFRQTIHHRSTTPTPSHVLLSTRSRRIDPGFTSIPRAKKSPLCPRDLANSHFQRSLLVSTSIIHFPRLRRHRPEVRVPSRRRRGGIASIWIAIDDRRSSHDRKRRTVSRDWKLVSPRLISLRPFRTAIDIPLFQPQSDSPNRIEVFSELPRHWSMKSPLSATQSTTSNLVRCKPLPTERCSSTTRRFHFSEVSTTSTAPLAQPVSPRFPPPTTKRLRGNTLPPLRPPPDRLGLSPPPLLRPLSPARPPRQLHLSRPTNSPATSRKFDRFRAELQQDSCERCRKPGGGPRVVRESLESRRRRVIDVVEQWVRNFGF